MSEPSHSDTFIYRWFTRPLDEILDADSGSRNESVAGLVLDGEAPILECQVWDVNHTLAITFHYIRRLFALSRYEVDKILVDE